jgi:hypothetical protein
MKKPASGSTVAGSFDQAYRQVTFVPSLTSPSRWRLSNSQVVSRRLAAAAVGNDVKRHFLSFVEARQTSALYGADMNENIVSAFVWLNEAKAFLAIEPFHGSCLHKINSSFGYARSNLNEIAEIRSRFFRRSSVRHARRGEAKSFGEARLRAK